MTGGPGYTFRRAVVRDDEIMLKASAQWKAEKPMNKILPLLFADGTRLDELEIDCASCARVLRTHLQRGLVCMVAPDTYTLSGLAACDQCRTLTRFSFLCSGTNGAVTLEWKSHGREMRMQVRATWWTRLAAWLSRGK